MERRMYYSTNESVSTIYRDTQRKKAALFSLRQQSEMAINVSIDAFIAKEESAWIESYQAGKTSGVVDFAGWGQQLKNQWGHYYLDPIDEYLSNVKEVAWREIRGLFTPKEIENNLKSLR